MSYRLLGESARVWQNVVEAGLRSLDARGNFLLSTELTIEACPVGAFGEAEPWKLVIAANTSVLVWRPNPRKDARHICYIATNMIEWTMVVPEGVDEFSVSGMRPGMIKF